MACGRKADAVIVRSIIELAHNLNLSVVAEGAEDRDTWDTLEHWGCNMTEGYFIAAPIDVETCTRWLGVRDTLGGLPRYIATSSPFPCAVTPASWQRGSATAVPRSSGPA